MIYKKIAFSLLGLFALGLVVVSFRIAGLAAAAPTAISFLILAVFGVWAYRRAEAWRSANPDTESQALPLSVFGGFKTIVVLAIATTVITMLLIALLSHI